ncbi:MAG: hypothetical protein AAB635_00370 [Patescibacteria group bacterium]
MEIVEIPSVELNEFHDGMGVTFDHILEGAKRKFGFNPLSLEAMCALALSDDSHGCDLVMATKAIIRSGDSWVFQRDVGEGFKMLRATRRTAEFSSWNFPGGVRMAFIFPRK